ncbi:hypothetical protein H5410_003742 [Solanum commersonii]|uniref:F-box associated beta-propeller type 1 domain-containing protein n=1 Tax=Solanum commersonii TaxID=4109 RepID=A0A9J6B5S4_SOLCO|nr:hypothetical protein H5410_003742 [Solanum commersonii]
MKNIFLHTKHTLNSTYDNILLERSFKEDIERYKAVFSFISNDDEDNLNIVHPDLDVPYTSSISSVKSDKRINSSHVLIALMEPRTTIVGGFGYDSVVNDFKVFRISEVFKEDGFGHINDGEKRVEVYELGIDIWRKLDHVDQQLPKLFWLNSSMSYKGCYHWIASFEGQKIILCFDMTTEIFRNIQMPADTSTFTEGTVHSLLILNESLSLLCYPSTTDFMEISIMKDYNIYESWIKKYTIIGVPTENPLVMWKDYVLLFQSKSGYLMSYDLKRDAIKELNIQGCPKSMRVVIYKEFLSPIQRES